MLTFIIFVRVILYLSLGLFLIHGFYCHIVILVGRTSSVIFVDSVINCGYFINIGGFVCDGSIVGV